MSEGRFSRTELLIGREGIKKLSESTVAVFGLGGVGGYAVEALARSGIGHLVLVDHDTVSLSNCNRQVIATEHTVGKLKTDVLKERLLEINPGMKVTVYPCFFLPENAVEFDFSSYDYVVDAVDTVTAKLEIIRQAKKAGVPVISAMGAGNKLNATAFRVADIKNTKVCPLARIMRRELKKRGMEGVKVVYSEEEAIKPQTVPGEETALKGGRIAPGSISYVPGVAGLILAGEVIQDLLG